MLIGFKLLKREEDSWNSYYWNVVLCYFIYFS